MNKGISWFFVQLCFLILKSTAVPDVTLVLQKLPGNDSNFNMTCVLSGENLNSGIAWIRPLRLGPRIYVSKYVPNFLEDYSCKRKYNQTSCRIGWKLFENGWNIKNSQETNLDVVTDNRWEEFPIIYTDGQKLFYYVDNFVKTNKITINFSIRVKNEAHIFLCDTWDPPHSSCYWILLGGYAGKIIAIRKCVNNIPNNFGISFDPRCRNFKKINEISTDKFLNEDIWKHFMLTINENNIILKSVSNDEILLNYTDNEKPYINTTFLIVRSAMVPSYWKFHTYEFWYITNTANTQIPMGSLIEIKDNRVCISLYVAMCSQCSLIISMFSQGKNDFIGTKTIMPLKERTWQEVRMNMSISTNSSHVQLYTERLCSNDCQEQFWAIDYFRRCADNEVRVFNVQGNVLESSFQILASPSRNMNIKASTSLTDVAPISDPKCNIYSIGSTTCTNCSKIVGNVFCQESIICDYSIKDEGICRCSPGYTGKTCQTQCSVSFYGNNCTEKCGFCQDLPCHFITGNCPASSGCHSGFQGQQCKIPPYPILKNPPIFIDSSYFNITIQINDFSYIGSSQPEKLKVKYELTSDYKTGFETHSYQFPDTNQITLTDLNPETSYRIRIILLTSDNEFYNGTYGVKSIVAKTTCADIQEDDIEVHTTASDAVFTFRKRPELCQLKNYEVKFITDILDETNNEFRIPNLNPYTNYTITIRNINNQSRTLYYNFKTQEGVPSAVLSFDVFSSRARSLIVSWKEPSELNGQLRHYKIYYRHHRYLACPKNYSHNHNQKIIETIINYNLTKTTLYNLIPYSEYIIQIAAVTVAAGELSRITGETAESDIPDESEIPLNISVQPSSTEAKITLEQPNCSFIKGQIEYYISAQCTSNWCSKSTISTLNSDYYLAQQELNLTGLLPYSTYIMDVKVGRTNKILYKDKLRTTTFKTLPAAPNAVKFDIYEESEDILRLRITPPYPPTGELEQYVVKYCELIYNKFYGNCEYQDFEPVSCKLRTEYHCVDISQNLNGNRLYRVYVQARNKYITTLGPKVFNAEQTIQRSSYAPEELSYSWDNYYNLTLQWNHPYITNGPLTKFVITLSKINITCFKYDYIVSEETARLTYNNMYSVENKDCYTSRLTVTIQSFNEVAGKTATLDIYSPPETPALTNQPYIVNISNTAITIALSVQKILISKSFLYIILSETKSKFKLGNLEDSLHKLENFDTLVPERLIAKYNLNTEVPMENLTIGNDSTIDSLLNDVVNTEITLTPNTLYTITIIILNEYQARKRYRVYEIVQKTSNNYSSNNALYFIILLLLFLPLLWICYRKRKTGRWCSIRSNKRNRRRDRRNSGGIPLKQNLVTYPIISDPDVQISPDLVNNLQLNKIGDNINSCKFSKVIRVTDFHKYVKKSIINGELERQHSLILGEQTIEPLDYGYVIPNGSNDILTDDIQEENKYEEIDCDQYSDNIIANYLEGYISKNAYVVTSIPQVAAVNKFWKLIWNDNVKYIVLLSSFIEEEKRNIKQYWPKINETTQYGNVSVKFVSSEIFADYEYRTFLVSSKDVERQVQQLHFTSWPDYGVPMYPHSLVPLFKILQTFPESNSPIAIHCSVGMEPIGTIILCDLCLKMAVHEEVMDIIKCLRKIRAQLRKLIRSFEQYKFVHLVLLECLIHPDTSIACDNEAENNILRLLESTAIEEQFQYISEVAWQDQAMKPLLEVYEEPTWKEKNRVQNIVPSGHGRVYLSRYPITEENSDYINAVEVDGLKAPKRFIVTQQPLPNTISDFWRMIDEKEVSTIVSLNTISIENDRSCVFWPTLLINEIQPVPYLLIKFIQKIRNQEITIVNLELCNMRNKEHFKRDICLIKLKNWPANQLIPDLNSTLANVWCEVKKLPQTKHPIVVTCYDGATACGLFIAFTFVLEKIKLERQCDVCLAVRTVRRNRAQFVSKLEQFKYLYRAAIAHLARFELYANISSHRP